jgi:hypothetical protein
MNDQPGEGREGPPDNRPYLCIPYWTMPLASGGTWDTGQQRPLPGSVVYYLCPGIQASPYTPGELLHVTVDVRNSGPGNAAALATVVVYWAIPTAGFAAPRFFAATTVATTPNRTTPTPARTATLTARIPADAPDHICLLAIVSHPQDKAGTGYDPVGDRHWAQRNLTAVPVAAGAPGLVPFMVGNPFADEASFDVQVAPAERRGAAAVAAALGLAPAETRPLLRLLDAEGGEVSEQGHEVGTSVGLKGHGEQAFQVLVELGDDLPPGTAGALEVLLRDRRTERVVGALGIALLPPG